METLMKKEINTMIKNIANHYFAAIKNSAITIDDLIIEGQMAVVQAEKTWVATGGSSFKTYAYRAISSAIKRFAFANMNTVHIPEWVATAKNEEDRIKHSYMRIGYSTTDDSQAFEIADTSVNQYSFENEMAVNEIMRSIEKSFDPTKQDIILSYFGFKSSHVDANGKPKVENVSSIAARLNMSNYTVKKVIDDALVEIKANM